MLPRAVLSSTRVGIQYSIASARHAIRPNVFRNGPASPTLPRQQSRTIFDALRNEIKKQYASGNLARAKPQLIIGVLVCGIGVTVTTVGVLSYLDWVQKTLHNFPDSVAAELRKALYYRQNGMYKDSLEHYRKALEEAAECQMNPLSDEVTGVKIDIATFLGERGRKDKEMEVLWGVWDELSRAYGVYPPGKERRRLAKRAVETGIKLGAVAGERGMKKRQEEVLTKAVELMLNEFPIDEQGEFKRVEDASELEKGENKYRFTNEELGAALEALGHFYEENEKPALATPLFLRALSLCNPKSCHATNLMSALSSTLAHHPLPPSVSRVEFLSNATMWARKALEVEKTITSPERTEECDEACISATYNLGAIAELMGEAGEARRRFEEARALSEKLNMEEGLRKAEEGLRRLQGLSA